MKHRFKQLHVNVKHQFSGTYRSKCKDEALELSSLGGNPSPQLFGIMTLGNLTSPGPWCK